MPEKEFNLIDEPWVRVLNADGSTAEVSLRDALVRAHEFIDLGGETQTQNIAVLRLLLAVVHTVFSRMDENGEAAPLEDEEMALDRWAALWENGALPEQPIAAYLDKWHERFWLFHPERPFMQAVSAENGTSNDAKKLIGELSESNNKIRLFQMRSGDGKTSVCYSEAARWLIYLNAFDDNGLKPRKNDAATWVGRLGVVYAIGRSLFETLLLNMVLLKDNQEIWQENRPLWEQEPRKWLNKIPVPDNQAEILTVQNHRILLERENGRVKRYTVVNGDYFGTENIFTEQMTKWYLKEKKSDANIYTPVKWDASRQMWRDFSNLFLSADGAKMPGVVSWGAFLRKKRIVSAKITHFGALSVQYKGQFMSSIVDSYGDELTFHTALFSEINEGWLNRIGEEVAKCDWIAQKAGLLSQVIHIASGGNPKDKKKTERMARAKEMWYAQVDEPFRKWLRQLDPDTMSIDEAVSQWLEQERRLAFAFGEQMVKRAGSRVLFGRKADDETVSGAKALLRYKGAVNNILWGGKTK